MKILFQGDSITDAGRDRKDFHDMGNGYPKYAAELIKNALPDSELINLGVSGDRSCDLVKRWKKDCIDLQPDIVSILIGVNDTWRAFDRNDPTSAEQYEANYRKLLEDIKKNTGAKIIILEPFLLDSDENKLCFRADLTEKIDVARRLAREYADVFIPLDGLFAAACLNKKPEFFSADGVHPAQGGAEFIGKLYASVVLRLTDNN